MTQLTFGNKFGDEAVVPTIETPELEKSSWYKGRTLSHSSISTYQACPQKWKFRYIDKIPERPRSFFSFGKSVHSGLEFLFSKPEAFPSLDDLLASFRTTWIGEGYDSHSQERWFFQEGERILRGFYVKHQHDKKKVLQVELKFTVMIEGVPITGYIDRIDETPSGRVSIVDYKTGKAFDKTRVKSDPQLTLYQIAVKDIYKKEVEDLTLYHLNSLTPLTVPAHSRGMEDVMRGVVVDVAKQISDNKYEAKPDANGVCRYCDYFQICPAFAGKKRPSYMEQSIEEGAKETADRYGKVQDRLSQLQEEGEALRKTIETYFQNNSVTEIKGRHYAVTQEAAQDAPTHIKVEKIDEKPS